jgi:hypothetical protein
MENWIDFLPANCPLLMGAALVAVLKVRRLMRPLQPIFFHRSPNQNHQCPERGYAAAASDLCCILTCPSLADFDPLRLPFSGLPECDSSRLPLLGQFKLQSAR